MRRQAKAAWGYGIIRALAAAVLVLCMMMALSGCAHTRKVELDMGLFGQQPASAVAEPGSSSALPVYDGPFAMGNTPGNYANHLGVLEYEGDAYVTLRGQGQTQLFTLGEDGATPSDLPGALQALDGWLYYHDAQGALVRWRPGGETQTVLETDELVWDWRVAGGYLYGLEDINEGEAYMPTMVLWRRPIEGGAIMNYPGNVDLFALSEDYLFFTTRTDTGVARIPLRDDAAPQAEWLDIPATRLFWQDGWLYYSIEAEDQDGWWGSVWRCREDGSGTQLLVQHAGVGFNAEGGWLYYSRQLQPKNSDDWYPPSVLERMNLDTGEVQALDARERAHGNICLAGDWVVFQASAEAGGADENASPRQLCYVAKDGGQVHILETP